MNKTVLAQALKFKDTTPSNTQIKNLIEDDLKSDDIIIKQKYSQPPYRERMHPKDVVVFHRCRIRNRPNSGHGFTQ